MSGIGDPWLDLTLELAEPRSDDVVLDYRCGVGALAFALAPAVASVIAVDVDAEMLREAERLQTELGFTNVTFSTVDPWELPFASGSFGLIVCRNALHAVPDPLEVLAELRRVLGLKGRMVLEEAVVDETTDRLLNELARLREPDHWRHYRAEEYDELFAHAELQVVDRRTAHRSVDLDYWIDAAQTPARHAGIIRGRMQQLPVQAQIALDVAFADRRISFSYDVLAVRLAR